MTIVSCPFCVLSSVRRCMRATLRATIPIALAWGFLALFAISATSQIKVDPNTEGNTQGSACSLQEAIYATEFGPNVALNQTDDDTTYYTGCSDPSGAWNVIDLPGGTLKFTQFWDGDSHNPFGPTATPIIFKAITIR